MFKNKIILLFLVAAAVGAIVFYYDRWPVVAGSVRTELDSLLAKLTRVEKRVMYSAQALAPFRKDFDVALRVPFHKQEHALSCEIAALKMALNFYGVAVSESDLLRDLPFSAKTSRGEGNIWGDPDKGFVGNIDGKIPNGGYGVYEQPIIDLALQYREAKKMEEATLADVLNKVQGGHPVIVWGSLASGKNISWLTPEDKYIKAIYGEHTRVVIGYRGTPGDPKYILLLDPIYGRVTMSKNKFLKDWALLDNKAVVVY